ncbi:uncharacterized protein LOC133175142 [Saccostrea echinata]|uniref:uncharacterized protein LOC133175142 n=1 Tax=Saccostrea echinata TaxID=191078 RepID=UPI002A7FCCDE|nr:uncharacterized protein LOC133175142 [Saccostrea echinata]
MHLVLGKLMSIIFLLMPVVLSQGINGNEVTEEFCHGETKDINTTVLKCDVKDIRVAVESDSNLIVQCDFSSGVGCHFGTYDKTHHLLKFSFIFYYEKHARKRLWVNSTCRDGRASKRLINLIPCVSDFTVKATHNNTHASLTCKHTFFSLSRGIYIKNKNSGDFIEFCKWNEKIAATQCQSKEQGHIHKNGIDGFITDYPQEYQCIMDGQTIDFEPEKVSSTPGNHATSATGSGQWSVSSNKFIGNNKTDTINGCTSHSLSARVLMLSLIIAYNAQYFIERGFVFLPS